MALHRVMVKNQKLTDDQLTQMKTRLRDLCRFLESKDGQTLHFPPQSDTKTVYSVDCGAMVNEFSAFLLALSFYLGDYRRSVEIQTERC